MELFFDHDIARTNVLNELESRHCISVLRRKAGDIISVADGRGRYYSCRIREAHPKRCKVDILSFEEHAKRSFNVHLAMAPTKNTDRLEWFAEKATEIGIESISLLLCDHSERKKIRLDRLEKIIISATKQSLKPFKPSLFDLTTFQQFIDEHPAGGYIAHCQKNDLPHLMTCCKKNEDALVLIGPEGDFSTEEVAYALRHGFTEVSLGKSRLRTETAGIVACHTLNLLNE